MDADPGGGGGPGESGTVQLDDDDDEAVEEPADTVADTPVDVEEGDKHSLQTLKQKGAECYMIAPTLSMVNSNPEKFSFDPTATSWAVPLTPATTVTAADIAAVRALRGGPSTPTNAMIVLTAVYKNVSWDKAKGVPLKPKGGQTRDTQKLFDATETREQLSPLTTGSDFAAWSKSKWKMGASTLTKIGAKTAPNASVVLRRIRTTFGAQKPKYPDAELEAMNWKQLKAEAAKKGGKSKKAQSYIDSFGKMKGAGAHGDHALMVSGSPAELADMEWQDQRGGEDSITGSHKLKDLKVTKLSSDGDLNQFPWKKAYWAPTDLYIANTETAVEDDNVG